MSPRTDAGLALAGDRSWQRSVREKRAPFRCFGARLASRESAVPRDASTSESGANRALKEPWPFTYRTQPLWLATKMRCSRRDHSWEDGSLWNGDDTRRVVAWLTASRN